METERHPQLPSSLPLLQQPSNEFHQTPPPSSQSPPPPPPPLAPLHFIESVHRPVIVRRKPRRPPASTLNMKLPLSAKWKWLIGRKDAAVFAVANVLILGISGSFAALVIPRAIQEISIAIVPIFAWLLLASMVHLWTTSLTDPGFLPMGLVPMPSSNNQEPDSTVIETGGLTEDAQHAETSGGVLPSQYPFIQVSHRGDFPVRPVYQDALIAVVNGVEVNIKYCYTCEIWRPPRASHCGSCGRCVENHDHHCPWTGTCIGRHNYRYFVFFVLTTWLLACLVAILCIVLIAELAKKLNTGNGGDWLVIMEMYPALPLLAVFSGMFALPLGCIFGYHIWLSSRNVTTHEDMKRKYGSDPVDDHRLNWDERRRNRMSVNPFDRGSWVANLTWIFCRPPELSHDPLGRFDSRRTVADESQPSRAITVDAWASRLGGER